MSSADDIVVDAAGDVCCASCGRAELDNVKLKECDGCDLVKYCSDECEEDHRPEHEATCNERAAELREEILLRQPESTHLGDCPICCLPLPLQQDKWGMFSCCSNIICNGCFYSDRYARTGTVKSTCPFCRLALHNTDEEASKNLMKRVAANDPVAMSEMGVKHCHKAEYDAAFEYYIKAAELGDADAHYSLAVMYQCGDGVEKDEEKELFHLEEAAIRGHPDARYSLGRSKMMNGDFEIAVKHFIIAATLGFDDAIKALKEFYKEGFVSKEDFATDLRAHQAAINATKSPQRKAAAIFCKRFTVDLR